MLQLRQTHQQDTLAPSEEYYWNTGSVLFNHPQEVELWSLAVPAIPAGEASLPTPPDTVSECSSSSDFFEMTAPSWPIGSMPEDWIPFPAGEYRTTPQPCPEDWSSQGAPVTCQGLQALEASSYLNVPQGSVVSGASPVLSHESQSSYTLPSISEPEPFVLPSAVDFSFPAEAGWSSSGPQVYKVPDVPSPLSGHGQLPVYGQSGMIMGCSVPTAPVTYPGSQPQMFYYPEGQAVYQSRAVSYPHVQPVRTILPRTHSAMSAPPQLAQGPRRSSRPHMQGSRTPRSIASSVSTLSGPGPETMQRTSSGSQMSGYHTSLHHVGNSLESPVQGPVTTSAHIHSSMVRERQPIPVSSHGQMYTFSDAGTSFPMAHEDNVITPGALSYAPGYDVFYPIQASMPEEFHSVPATGSDVKPEVMGSKESEAAVSTERDEASYRTDPLYDVGPQSDGLYHCPHENDDPGCGHKPVKLRCNYAKYIDSHLKPFICKHGYCATQIQKFSSTACLLRHEREAHGMYGHGERPHMCRYAGCDRSQEGAGFPRKYNLLDHMKRVHGYVDEEGLFQTKSAAGRKRKDASAPEAAPKTKTQRQKTMPLSAKSSATGTVPLPQHGYVRARVLHGQFQGSPPGQDTMFAGWNGQMYGHPYLPSSHKG